MSIKGLIVAAVALIVAVAGFFIWRNQEARADAARVEAATLKGLTAEEIQQILQSLAAVDPQTVAAMKDSPEARQVFLKKLRGTFALAAEARREGLEASENFKNEIEFKKNQVLQSMYIGRLGPERIRELLTAETIEAVWNDGENENRFNREMEALEAERKAHAESRGTHALAPKLEGEKLKRARRDWAMMKIVTDNAKADAEFMAQPVVALRFKILEAGILAADYANKHWQKKIKATDEEVKAYLAAHPEYDIAKKRQRAEEALKRAKAGEDFAKLAAEFSEDRSTKDKGGLYENVGAGVLWEEVQAAALKMESGQVADTVIETNNGYHVVKLEKKETGENGKLSLRHIMLQKAFEEPNNVRPGVPPPFMSAQEIAKAEVEREKYDALVAQLIERNRISMPDDFAVYLPEQTENSKPGIPTVANESKPSTVEGQ